MRRKALSIRKLGYMILLFPLIEPKAFEQIHLLDIVFNMLKLCSFLSIFILYIGKYRKIDKFSFAVVFCYFIGLVSTAFNGGWVYSSLVQLVSLTSMILLVELMLEEDPMLCFDVFLPLLEILLYANLASIIIFPDGMYSEVTQYYEQTENWLLGLDNTQLPYFIAGITITVIRDYYRAGEIRLSFRSWALIAICLITICIRWPATSVVGMIIILPVILVPRLFVRSKILNIITYLVVVALFFFGIVIFRFQYYFAFLIQGVLHKNLSFSGRTGIWDYTMDAIRQSPVLGFGSLSLEQAWSLIHQSHAHNIFLQMMFSGGVMSLLLFIYMHIIIAIKLMKNNHNGIASFLSVIVFSVLIVNQAEVYQSGLIFLVYVLAYHSDKIIVRQRAYQYIKEKNPHSCRFSRVKYHVSYR